MQNCTSLTVNQIDYFTSTYIFDKCLSLISFHSCGALHDTLNCDPSEKMKNMSNEQKMIFWLIQQKLPPTILLKTWRRVPQLRCEHVLCKSLIRWKICLISFFFFFCGESYNSSAILFFYYLLSNSCLMSKEK